MKKISEAIFTAASATLDLSAKQSAVAKLNPSHPKMEQISVLEKKLEDFSKFEVLEIVEGLRKGSHNTFVHSEVIWKSLHVEVRAPLDERAQKAKEIENKLKDRQKTREDYSYYLGKVRKLKETHKIHLKNGQVEKLTFTEKLERNEKKVKLFKCFSLFLIIDRQVEACKDTFEKHRFNPFLQSKFDLTYALDHIARNWTRTSLSFLPRIPERRDKLFLRL